MREQGVVESREEVGDTLRGRESRVSHLQTAGLNPKRLALLKGKREERGPTCPNCSTAFLLLLAFALPV